MISPVTDIQQGIDCCPGKVNRKLYECGGCVRAKYYSCYCKHEAQKSSVFEFWMENGGGWWLFSSFSIASRDYSYILSISYSLLFTFQNSMLRHTDPSITAAMREPRSRTYPFWRPGSIEHEKLVELVEVKLVLSHWTFSISARFQTSSKIPGYTQRKLRKILRIFRRASRPRKVYENDNETRKIKENACMEKSWMISFVHGVYQSLYCFSNHKIATVVRICFSSTMNLLVLLSDSLIVCHRHFFRKLVSFLRFTMQYSQCVSAV